MSHRARHALLTAAACGLGLACGGPESLDKGALDFDRDLPELAADPGAVMPYTGDNETVLEAQAQIHDGFALQTNVINRTCGPTNGVCHNAKEYPDLHTPANLMNAVGAPCNVQPLSAEGVFDRCERPGDRFQLTADLPELEIAYIEYVAGEGEYNDDQAPNAESPGLHIYLAGPLPTDRQSFYESGRFIRTFVNAEQDVEDLPFFTYRSRWWIVDADGYAFNVDEDGNGESGAHLMAEVAPYQAGQIEELLSVGLEEGDLNRNGVLGARQDGNPISMIEPGKPELSYIVGRLRGTLEGEVVPGTRMPLANQPLSNAEMLALFCFIEGLASVDGTVNMSAPIDYAGCSYSSNPETLELLGSGVTWEGRIKRILEFNCGGCHGGDAPMAELNLLTGDVHTRVLEASSQAPQLNLIEPGLPGQSYLFLKVTADESIVGQPMPINPLTGMGGLKQQELLDIQTWIEEGALMTGGEDMDPTPDGGMGMDPVMMDEDAGTP